MAKQSMQAVNVNCLPQYLSLHGPEILHQVLRWTFASIDDVNGSGQGIVSMHSIAKSHTLIRLSSFVFPVICLGVWQRGLLMLVGSYLTLIIFYPLYKDPYQSSGIVHHCWQEIRQSRSAGIYH